MRRFISKLSNAEEDKQALIPPGSRPTSDVPSSEDVAETREAGRGPDTLYKTFHHSHPFFRPPDQPVADLHGHLAESDRPSGVSPVSSDSCWTSGGDHLAGSISGDVAEAAADGESGAAVQGSHQSPAASREAPLQAAGSPIGSDPLSFRSSELQSQGHSASGRFFHPSQPEVAQESTSGYRLPDNQRVRMDRDGDSWSNGKTPETPSSYTSKTEIFTDGGVKGPRGGHGNRMFVYVLACFATIGGLLFGYDTGIVSGSMLLIKPVFRLDTVWQEVIVSGTIGAAAIFSLIAGVVCDFLGRRITIMAASFIFAVGAIVMAASPNKEVLLAGRIIVGAGIGFASMTVPVYVAEAAPPDIRGRLVTLNQLFITIGILISSIVAGAFSGMKDTGWKYMLGLAAIPGVVQFIGFIFLPESPRWLLSKGREDDARKVLQRIRGQNDVEEELREVLEAEKNSQTGFVLKEILKTPHVLKALFVGGGLQLFQQLCGINTVIYYSASILKLAGFPPQKAIWLVCVPNAVNFLATFIGLGTVERFGRKKLLVFSFIGVIIALAVLAAGFQLSATYSPSINSNYSKEGLSDMWVSDACTNYSVCEDCILNKDCGYCYDESDSNIASCARALNDDEELHAKYGGCSSNWTSGRTGESLKWAYGYCPTSYTWMAVLGLALFVLSFAPGLGPMPWTINSEIYPMWARGTANAIATAINWIFNLIVSFTFLTLTETITKHGTFWLFAGICVVGMIFTLIFVPETKNKSLEEVEELFMSPSERKKRQQQREAKANVVADDKPISNTKL